MTIYSYFQRFVANRFGAIVLIALVSFHGALGQALSISDVSSNEGFSGFGSMQMFVISLSTASANTVTVDYEINDGTAIAPDDYVDDAGTLTFLPGEIGKTIVVQVVGDDTDELDETYTVQLSNAINAAIGDDTGVGTIQNDDSAFQPQLTFSVSTTDEVSEGDLTYLVWDYDRASGRETDFSIRVDFSSTAQGGDYTLAQTLVTVPAGKVRDSIRIDILDDLLVEGPEELTLTFNMTSGINTLNTMPFTFTLLDTDAVTLSIDDVSETEGDAGTKTMTFTVSAHMAPGVTVPNTFAVDYATSDGTASVSGADYIPRSGTLNFSGTTNETQTFDITLRGDTDEEADETFVVTLSNIFAFLGENITFSDDTAIGTILDDDSAPLPVTWVFFKATMSKAGHLLLHWRTSTELNNDGFFVERSASGMDFERLAFIKGQGDHIGVTDYDFEVIDAKTGYYRLAQVDFDGTTDYSKVRYVTRLFGRQEIQVFPNPYSGGAPLTVLFDTSSASQALRAHLTDIEGQEIWKAKGTPSAIALELQAQLLAVSAGLYVLQLSSATDQGISRLIVR